MTVGNLTAGNLTTGQVPTGQVPSGQVPSGHVGFPTELSGPMWFLVGSKSLSK